MRLVVLAVGGFDSLCDPIYPLFNVHLMSK